MTKKQIAEALREITSGLGTSTVSLTRERLTAMIAKIEASEARRVAPKGSGKSLNDEGWMELATPIYTE